MWTCFVLHSSRFLPPNFLIGYTSDFLHPFFSTLVHFLIMCPHISASEGRNDWNSFLHMWDVRPFWHNLCHHGMLIELSLYLLSFVNTFRMFHLHSTSCTNMNWSTQREYVFQFLCKCSVNGWGVLVQPEGHFQYVFSEALSKQCRCYRMLIYYVFYKKIEGVWEKLCFSWTPTWK